MLWTIVVFASLIKSGYVKFRGIRGAPGVQTWTIMAGNKKCVLQGPYWRLDFGGQEELNSRAPMRHNVTDFCFGRTISKSLNNGVIKNLASKNRVMSKRRFAFFSSTQKEPVRCYGGCLLFFCKFSLPSVTSEPDENGRKHRI